ncbi:MAG TPA: head-tail adaptor protein [Coriobacteriia bacterium]
MGRHPVSFDDRLIHQLVVMRMAATGSTDDYGQPIMAATTVATVPGLIQPRSAREVALASQAGAAIGTHVGYMRPLAGLTTRDWIEHDGQRYDIVSVPDAAGLGHHLELGLVAVT